MSTPTSKSAYLLLFRGCNWDKELSPEELQQVMGQVTAWFEDLYQKGKVKAAQPLGDEGKMVSGKKGQTVADGPFAESKEAIAGYLLLAVDDMDEAVSIAQTWPCLAYGASAELRPVLKECSTFQRLKSRLDHAVA